ncbi:precorrin-2 dehydrogenase/sirohydrochlorin ferrochelatase family protein [Mangrovicoccus algicola]|uniref:precorrin-2 dehydrogenase n=1 Tax=Mangrovicoccus algicola TaxID=2771008 RepID=A0A8J6Z582_9RHOB|nr:bifunctional precorrin-2 dehydrogenase/sirohydrochlorin ferrochelatase [Mangrovicoccus algicola]MBE3637914.1 siroheme synthase [Mangrovicoccus algicola]
MQTFPMFLQVGGRTVLILGGGEQAAQKCRLLLKTEARIVVQAPQIDEELQDLVARGRVAHDRAPPTARACAGAAITFIGTGCPGCDAALHGLAKAGGALVNVVDQPGLCDAYTPSIVDRDPLVVAIGSEGAAPVLARQIKTRVEEMLEPRLGDLVALSGRLRGQVARHVPRDRRRAFWRWVFTGAPRQRHAAGAEREAVRLIKEAIAAGGPPGQRTAGLLSLIPTTPDRDHLTLQAVQRLQEADLILHDTATGTAPLELARRDADRMALDGALAPADPAALVAEALAAGARVAVLHGPGTDTAPLEAAAGAAETERLRGVTP